MIGEKHSIPPQEKRIDSMNAIRALNGEPPLALDGWCYGESIVFALETWHERQTAWFKNMCHLSTLDDKEKNTIALGNLKEKPLREVSSFMDSILTFFKPALLTFDKNNDYNQNHYSQLYLDEMINWNLGYTTGNDFQDTTIKPKTIDEENLFETQFFQTVESTKDDDYDDDDEIKALSKNLLKIGLEKALYTLSILCGTQYKKIIMISVSVGASRRDHSVVAFFNPENNEYDYFDPNGYFIKNLTAKALAEILCNKYESFDLTTIGKKNEPLLMFKDGSLIGKTQIVYIRKAIEDYWKNMRSFNFPLKIIEKTLEIDKSLLRKIIPKNITSSLLENIEFQDALRLNKLEGKSTDEIIQLWLEILKNEHKEVIASLLLDASPKIFPDDLPEIIEKWDISRTLYLSQLLTLKEFHKNLKGNISEEKFKIISSSLIKAFLCNLSGSPLTKERLIKGLLTILGLYGEGLENPFWKDPNITKTLTLLIENGLTLDMLEKHFFSGLNKTEINDAKKNTLIKIWENSTPKIVRKASPKM